MKKRIISFAAMVLLTAATLTGCGGGGSREASETAQDTGYGGAMQKNAAVDMAMAEEAGDYDDYEYNDEAYSTAGIVSGTKAAENSSSASDRKLIRTVSMTVETLEYDALISTIKSRVSQLDGYFEDLSESKNSWSSQTRHANMTIRVPKAQADELIQVMEKESNILDRSENVNDVTLDYVDMESHKKALQAEQDRLLELMEKAESIEDIITIESRLSDVRYQIESMESQLRTYDNRIDYTTIYLNVNEVERITPVEEPGFFTRVKEGFAESLEGAADIIKDIIAWVIINIPYLILWAIFILFLIFVIIRPLVRKMKKSSEKRKKEYQEFMLKKAAAASVAPVMLAAPTSDAGTVSAAQKAPGDKAPVPVGKKGSENAEKDKKEDETVKNAQKK